jgi:hypothetical protein
VAPDRVTRHLCANVRVDMTPIPLTPTTVLIVSGAGDDANVTFR